MKEIHRCLRSLALEGYPYSFALWLLDSSTGPYFASRAEEAINLGITSVGPHRRKLYTTNTLFGLIDTSTMKKMRFIAARCCS